jgi:hypothetical protein
MEISWAKREADGHPSQEFRMLPDNFTTQYIGPHPCVIQQIARSLLRLISPLYLICQVSGNHPRSNGIFTSQIASQACAVEAVELRNSQLRFGFAVNG